MPPAVVVSFIALRIRIRSPSGASERESGRVARAKDNMLERRLRFAEIMDRLFARELDREWTDRKEG